jgi:hypothetical protein
MKMEAHKSNSETFRLFFAFIIDMFLIPAFEFIHPSSGVDKLHFPGKIRMRGMRYFKFYQWVFHSIFPQYCFFCLYGGLGQEGIFVRHVFENDEPVIFRMNIFFHFVTDFSNKGAKVKIFLQITKYPARIIDFYSFYFIQIQQKPDRINIICIIQ